MSEFYVPPPEIVTRIIDYPGQHVLSKGSNGHHDRYGNYTTVALVSASSDGDDQYWSLEGRGGTCLFRNKGMGKVIIVGSANDPVPFFLAPGSLTSGASAQSFITLEPGTGQYDGYFRLIRVCSDNVGILHSRSGRLEVVTLDSRDKIGSVPISSEQYFQFDYEPMDVDSIEYNFKESRRFNERPHILVDTYLSNDTGSDQTLTYELNEKTSTTSKWDYKVGIKLGFSKKVKTGVPGVAEGELAFDASFTAEWSQGKSVTREQAWKATFPVKARAGERIRAKSSVWMGNVEVPYTLVLKNRAGHRVEQKGIWHGVLAWNLRHELKAEKPDGTEIRMIPVE
ncbi:hypothetical protein D9611_006067 [Ephemerocybe angulata]|uniref:Uncharacterized protein n=1 Tax=Ephemerocybe angulata TaxID=980116 RepID=A0A8H5FLH9_9AGAR|nr:hypothetical protein D9611_006067 [Tulosesus angulatus]